MYTKVLTKPHNVYFMTLEEKVDLCKVIDSFINDCEKPVNEENQEVICENLGLIISEYGKHSQDEGGLGKIKDITKACLDRDVDVKGTLSGGICCANLSIAIFCKEMVSFLNKDIKGVFNVAGDSLDFSIRNPLTGKDKEISLKTKKYSRAAFTQAFKS